MWTVIFAVDLVDYTFEGVSLSDRYIYEWRVFVFGSQCTGVSAIMYHPTTTKIAPDIEYANSQ